MIRRTILAAATLVLAACSNGDSAVQPEAERLVPIRVAQAEQGPGAPAIRTTAVLAHQDEMRLAFKIGGVIARIAVDEGSQVQAGQVLAELELAEIGSQVEQSRQLLAKAERDLERGQRLYREQVIPLEALQDLTTQRDIAAQAVKATRFNREYAVITAPSDGVVLRKLAEARETVAPGAPVLVLGSADGGYVLKASLADRDVVQLALGDAAEVRFDALPGERLNARVTRLPAAADARTGMFDVELALAGQDARLRSGLVARLALTPATAGASTRVQVPIAAILEGDRQRASVFVYDRADSRVHRQAVDIAFIDDDRVALAAGLEVGASVVTEGAAYVEDGKKVRLIER
ncbi:MAG: efflux RND transporter periplasmic adaptor subunit [Lysobacterales bacterium]